jgi:hypothetical protein
MSRGPGHVQRMIADLIEANPDGGWSTSELCRLVYASCKPTKAQRVAVGRAIRRMTLPGTWDMRRVGRGERAETEHCLCDPCNIESVKAAVRAVRGAYYPDRFPRTFEPGGYYFEMVESARRWRDASPIERIDMDIERIQRAIGMICAAGSGPGASDWARALGERLCRLQEERTALLPN